MVFHGGCHSGFKPSHSFKCSSQMCPPPSSIDICPQGTVNRYPGRPSKTPAMRRTDILAARALKLLIGRRRKFRFHLTPSERFSRTTPCHALEIHSVRRTPPQRRHLPPRESARALPRLMSIGFRQEPESEPDNHRLLGAWLADRRRNLFSPGRRQARRPF